MTWTPPPTFNNQAILDAEILNTYLRDNMMETEVAKAQTPGAYFVSSGVNEVEERAWDSDFILAAESTASTTYVDLATYGPEVTVETGSQAIVFLSAGIKKTLTAGLARVSVQISGDTLLDPTVDYSLNFENPNFPNVEIQAGNYVVFQGLTPGRNTFTAKYLTTSGTATFQRRRITVLPF